MTLDTTKAYRGSKSMHYVATTGSGPSAYIVEKKTFSGTTKATNNDFWGRYFILSGLTSATALTSHAVYGTMGGTGAPAGADGLFHFVGGSRAVLQAEIRNTGDSYTDDMKSPNAKAPLSPPFPLMSDGWQCWEFHVQPDDSFSFFINGTEVQAMKITAGKAVKSGASFSPLPMITSLSIGWQYFGAGPNSGWIDEVAIGPTQIGCDH
jgi:hypothetical protein